MSDSNCRRKQGSVNKKCERQYGISSRKKAPEEQGKPTLKDMPSRLTIPAFFQRKQEKLVLNDGNDILEETAIIDSVVSSDVGVASECKVTMTSANVERFLAQLGKTQGCHSTLLFRRACLELCALQHNNKADTARRVMRVCPNAFANEESCRAALRNWAKRQDLLADIKFEEHVEHYVSNGSLKNIRNEGTSNPLSPSSQRASSLRPGPRS